jgi:catechol 2,3-dioxygenase-like lactoylglutathione lyase family enzyme
MTQAPTPRRAVLPGRPKMLSHVAYVTHDTSATARFYTEILGMELVAAVMDDSIPSTGDPVPYFHSFFRMNDGSTVAFFEAPELPAPNGASHPAYEVFQHLALEVDTPEEVDAWHDWLESNGVEVLGPVNHKIIYSIYFHDPNNVRLELTAPLDPTWNDQSQRAREQLREWEEVKRSAKQSGGALVDAVHELTTRRSHRLMSGLE